MQIAASASRAAAASTSAVMWRLATALGRGLTPATPRAVGAVVGPLAAALTPSTRRVVAATQRRVDPTLRPAALRRAVRRAYADYVRYYAESFAVPHASARVIERGFRVTGYEHIEAGLARGRGVILALPHLGGWEWAGRWLVSRGLRLHVVVERLASRAAFDAFVRVREGWGATVIPLDDDAGAAVQRALAANDVVALLCDRDVQGNGVAVRCFGEPTTVPAGPALLALRTGAALLPVGTYHGPGRYGHHAWVRPALEPVRAGRLRDDVAALAQRLVHEVEGLVRRAPEQWHVFTPNWEADRGLA